MLSSLRARRLWSFTRAIAQQPEACTPLFIQVEVEVHADESPAMLVHNECDSVQQD